MLDLFYMKVIVLFLFSLVVWNLSAQTEDSYEEEIPSFPIVIHYQNNSAEISHVSQYKLVILSEYLIQNPKINIVIEGHVCCGPAQRMSKKRAKSIYKRLLKHDVPKEQMMFVGKSFDEPKIIKEKSESDKDINRRVEIKIR